MSENNHFRSSPRPQLCSTVTLYIDKPVKRTIPALSQDVGKGGLFVLTDEPFEVGQTLRVDLASPSTWDPLSLHAKVCRLCNDDKRRGIALEFIDVPDEKLVSLVKLIEALDFES